MRRGVGLLARPSLPPPPPPPPLLLLLLLVLVAAGVVLGAGHGVRAAQGEQRGRRGGLALQLVTPPYRALLHAQELDLTAQPAKWRHRPFRRPGPKAFLLTPRDGSDGGAAGAGAGAGAEGGGNGGARDGVWEQGPDLQFSASEFLLMPGPRVVHFVDAFVGFEGLILTGTTEDHSQTQGRAGAGPNKKGSAADAEPMFAWTSEDYAADIFFRLSEEGLLDVRRNSFHPEDVSLEHKMLRVAREQERQRRAEDPDEMDDLDDGLADGAEVLAAEPEHMRAYSPEVSVVAEDITPFAFAALVDRVRPVNSAHQRILPDEDVFYDELNWFSEPPEHPDAYAPVGHQHTRCQSDLARSVRGKSPVHIDSVTSVRDAIGNTWETTSLLVRKPDEDTVLTTRSFDTETDTMSKTQYQHHASPIHLRVFPSLLVANRIFSLNYFHFLAQSLPAYVALQRFVPEPADSEAVPHGDTARMQGDEGADSAERSADGDFLGGRRSHKDRDEPDVEAAIGGGEEALAAAQADARRTRLLVYDRPFILEFMHLIGVPHENLLLYDPCSVYYAKEITAVAGVGFLPSRDSIDQILARPTIHALRHSDDPMPLLAAAHAEQLEYVAHLRGNVHSAPPPPRYAAVHPSLAAVLQLQEQPQQHIAVLVIRSSPSGASVSGSDSGGRGGLDSSSAADLGDRDDAPPARSFEDDRAVIKSVVRALDSAAWRVVVFDVAPGPLQHVSMNDADFTWLRGTWAVAEQIALFSRANLVVGASGAGLSNIMFQKDMPIPRALVEIVPAMHPFGNGLEVDFPTTKGFTYFWHLASAVKTTYRALLLPNSGWSSARMPVPPRALRKVVRDAWSGALEDHYARQRAAAQAMRSSTGGPWRRGDEL